MEEERFSILMLLINRVTCYFLMYDHSMSSVLQNPVAHCWSEPGLFKRKFCTLCRKRLEDCLAVRCES